MLLASRSTVNLLRLPPGAWSSQRHWHAREDEFVFVLSGEVVLVTDAGEEVSRAGDCACFKASDPNGHCLQNRGTRDATVLEIGSRIPGEYAIYPDIDMKTDSGGGYVHKDGTPYPKMTRRGLGSATTSDIDCYTPCRKSGRGTAAECAKRQRPPLYSTASMTWRQ
jgi:uncharacterized cupin superfamily protein